MYVVPDDARISDVIGPRAARRLYKRALSREHNDTAPQKPDIVLDRSSGKILLCTDQERPQKFQGLLTDDLRDVVMEHFRAMPLTLWTRTQRAKSFGPYVKRLQRPPEDDRDNDSKGPREPMKFVPVISMVPFSSVFKENSRIPRK